MLCPALSVGAKTPEHGTSRRGRGTPPLLPSPVRPRTPGPSPAQQGPCRSRPGRASWARVPSSPPLTLDQPPARQRAVARPQATLGEGTTRKPKRDEGQSGCRGTSLRQRPPAARSPRGSALPPGAGPRAPPSAAGNRGTSLWGPPRRRGHRSRHRASMWGLSETQALLGAAARGARVPLASTACEHPGSHERDSPRPGRRRPHCDQPRVSPRAATKRARLPAPGHQPVAPPRLRLHFAPLLPQQDHN